MTQALDLLIIGAGITGLCAARQARKLGLSTATMEALLPGGLVINVNQLDGDVEGSGSEFAAGLMLEARKLGAESIMAAATGIAQDGDLLTVTSDAGSHRARSVIIACGARLKRLGVPGESALEGRGVARCADCDGPFYQDQDVVVVGGGDSALQEALVLATFARQVHLVHRGSRFGAHQRFVARLASQPNVRVHWNTRVDAIVGEASVQAVRVRTGDAGAAGEIACSGFFAYVGLEPACEFVPAAVMRDARGFLLTGADLGTAMPGVYAAGAVRSGYGGLLSQAVAEGAAAARSAARQCRPDPA